MDWERKGEGYHSHPAKYPEISISLSPGSDLITTTQDLYLFTPPPPSRSGTPLETMRRLCGVFVRRGIYINRSMSLMVLAVLIMAGSGGFDYHGGRCHPDPN